MKLTPEKILRLFFHRKDAFATQQKSGAYYITKRRITLKDIQTHLNGNITLGAYCLEKDNTVKWACVDIDIHGNVSGADLRRVKAEGEEIFNEFTDYSRMLEESGRRGYHV